MAPSVHPNHPIPFLLGCIGERLHLVLDACIVEGNIKTAEDLHRPAKRGLDVTRLRDVAPDSDSNSSYFIDHLGSGEICILGNISQNDICPFACKGERGCPPNTAPGTCDKHHFSLESLLLN